LYIFISKQLNLYVDILLQIIRGLENITEQIREVLAADKKVMKLAESLYQKKSLLVMGRGYNYATCLEGALVSF
jgi:glutamine---fructose-6-phosphate transaminase (isomerizing)